MLDSGLDEVTRQRARATGIDWREAWLGIDAEGQVRGWPAAAAEAMGATVQDGLVALELGTALEPMRSAPAHASEMISEVRAGERLNGILRRDAWWLVAGEDGYVGWIHEWVVREANPERGPAAFLYARPLGTLWISDNHAAVPLVMGTPLWPVDGPMPERGGFHLLATASGEEGWVPVAELWPVVRDLTPLDALNFGRSLIGTPYRWGGRSPLGFDCSGFVQFIASLCAARLPRDASQQSRIGEALDREPGTWEAGDLLFFGEPADHVAMTDGRGQILHCQGRVRLEQISRREDLMDRLTEVRRWWGLRDIRPTGAWSFRGQ